MIIRSSISALPAGRRNLAPQTSRAHHLPRRVGQQAAFSLPAKPLRRLIAGITAFTILNSHNEGAMSDATSDLDIGARLRAVRSRISLSQRALAKRAGIANATISLIESNSINPSVGALKRILDCIPMSLSEFFSAETDTPPQIFYRADELTEIGQGAISFRQVGSDLANRAIQLLAERYQPGADTGKVPLRHEAEEAGIVVSGRMEVTVGTQRKVLGPGDAYYFNSREPHRFRVVGKEPCELISACTPPTV
jgi:transcriptional regulator with XRE-family HTH domain